MLVSGSWLSNIADEEGDEEHTAYFFSVTLLPTNNSWQLTRRYAACFRLFASIRPNIAKAFPRGMRTPFPDDRARAWAFGLTDAMRDRRRDRMNLWFQEILACEQLMLDLDVARKIHVFLELTFFL